jgi:hypothetical protein
MNSVRANRKLLCEAASGLNRYSLGTVNVFPHLKEKQQLFTPKCRLVSDLFQMNEVLKRFDEVNVYRGAMLILEEGAVKQLSASLFTLTTLRIRR